MMFAALPTLTQCNARTAWKTGLAHIAAGASCVDCALLTQFDSAALAVLLAWRRAAQARGVTLEVLNLPTQLANLAHAYGIDCLLVPVATH